MIINSKKKSFNCILLRKGGDKLFIHKYFPKPTLPLISTNYQKNINILFQKPKSKEIPNFSIDKNIFNKTENKKYQNINISTKSKTKTVAYESPKNEGISMELNDIDKSIKKTKSIGTLVNFDESSIKTPNNLNNKNNLDSNKSIFLNNNDYNYNNNTNNTYNDNCKNNNVLNHKIENFKKGDSLSNSTKSIDSILKRQKISKEKEIKEKIKKFNNRKKFFFMNNYLKDNKNFLIDDYLKSRLLAKNKKSVSFHEGRNIFSENKDGNNKGRQPILIKDIRIKSLLNDFENKKKKLIKLSPFIIKEKYLKNKYGGDINRISCFNDYELKMNVKNNKIYHITPIKLGNFRNIFDFSKTK